MQVSEITAFLEHAYDVLNREWFGGELRGEKGLYKKIGSGTHFLEK